MQTIDAILINDVLTPASSVPIDAVRVVCNGTTYTVYENGDELPLELVSE